jgi:predicted RNase H-like HicB family nuclease
MTLYFAVMHKNSKCKYGVSFPDLPGCVTAGSSIDEAFEKASATLADHLSALCSDNRAIPEPSSVATILEDPEARRGFIILVRGPDPSEDGGDS